MNLFAFFFLRMFLVLLLNIHCLLEYPDLRIYLKITYLLFCFSFSDASCELCGFYFENRKALASHARAHLRQFGVTEWCVNGSPIETLSAWIRSRPQKAAEMQQSYVQGARYTQKKV